MVQFANKTFYTLWYLGENSMKKRLKIWVLLENISCQHFWDEAWRFFFIKGFRTIVFIFVVISTTFRPIFLPTFFRCLSNSGTFMELRTTSVKVPEFYKHLKKAGGHMGRNVVEITIKMKTIVWKPFIIKNSRKYSTNNTCLGKKKTPTEFLNLSEKVPNTLRRTKQKE